MLNLCTEILNEMKLNLTDESLNSYGFWVKTDGIDMKRFEKNPIMLYNHHRTYSGKTDEMLPIGRWENLKVEKGVLTADAVFDEKDEFALKIKNKVEGGFLRGCSIGIRPIEYSDDPSLVKPGQKAMTISQCELMEVSIVDIPSNPNAADVVLYSADNSVISLTVGGDIPEEMKLNFTNNMNIALKLGLPEKASEQECLTAIEALQAAKKDVKALQDSNDALVKQVAELQKKESDALKAKADAIIDSAIKSGRIDAKAKEQFQQLFASDFENAKSIIDAIPERKGMADSINTGNGELSKLSWDDLDRNNRLAELKEKDIEAFKAKFKEKFKTDFKN